MYMYMYIIKKDGEEASGTPPSSLVTYIYIYIYIYI